MAKAYLIDMDGVLIKGKKLVSGAAEFIHRLREEGTPFLILTDNSRLRPQDFSSRFQKKGIEPACGAVAALITAATGVKPYFVGKPNPYMVRAALRRLGSHSEDTVMIGDRMDTDIMGGVESGMKTILVLSGLTNREDVNSYPYRPDRIVESVAEIE